MVQRLLFPPMPPTSSVAKGERIISLTSEQNLYDMHENNASFKIEYDETLKIQIDNDIKSNPKLTVDGIVHIQKELYRDYRYVHMCYVMLFIVIYFIHLL